MQWLAECGAPSVLVERDAVLLPGGTPVESVTTDHALGAVLAARHLASLGHRKVGLIISRDSPTSRKITRGWQAACAELGLTPTDHFESMLPPRTSPDFSAVVDAALDSALSTGVTALVVHSDPEAMAFVDLALNRGISVPGDLSVIAYDDEVAELFTPALTAVSPPAVGVGRAAVDLHRPAPRGPEPPRAPRRAEPDAQRPRLDRSPARRLNTPDAIRPSRARREHGPRHAVSAARSHASRPTASPAPPDARPPGRATPRRPRPPSAGSTAR